MAKYPDFRDMLKLLKERKAKYLIIGGHAVVFYSALKLTEDLDIWVKPSIENAEKVFDALTIFGFGTMDLNMQDFINEDSIVQIGYPPVRIDFLKKVEGLDFDEAYKRKELGYLFGIRNVPFLNIDDLIKNKKLAGRPKDKFDIRWIKMNFNPKRK